jgi:hypothetical protein
MTVDYKKATTWMSRERRWLNEYLVRVEQENVVQTRRQELADYASGTRDVGFGSSALDDLASYHGAAGCSRVLSGDDQGFRDLDLACLESFWMIRLLTRGYDLDQRPGKGPRILLERVATCWMHAEALGAIRIREWLDALIHKIEDGYPGVEGKYMSPLCTLVAWFVTGKPVAALERSGWAKIDAYAPVAAGSFTAQSYDELAAFHQKGVDGAGYPPFHFYPYRLAPFELQVIAKRTGVALEGKHPLLTSPLANSRLVPEIPVTDELRAVLESRAAEVTADG